MGVIEELKKLNRQEGSTLFDDTDERSGNWGAILILEAAVFEVLTDATRDGTTAITGITFTEGTILQGNFTTIKLTSGSVLAYKK
jgi:hypothetical protein